MKKGKLLVISLVIILVGCILAYAIQTDGGNVKVKDIKFAGKDGKILSALLFVPQNATNKTPAPGVLSMHGYINSRETQSGFAIEFARRGYVVLEMDMAGHGYSQQIKDDLTRGAEDGLLYLYNLPFVDKTNIATEGHSMGGWSTLSAAGMHPDIVKTVILEGSSPETYGAPKVLADTKFNFCVVFSKADEFAQLMWGISDPRDIVKTDKLKNAFGAKGNVVPEKLYGSFSDESARKLYQPDNTHPGDHISTAAIGDAVEFLQDSMKAPNPLPKSDQIWPWKEFATALALVGVGLFIFGIGSLLLKTNYFGKITQTASHAVTQKSYVWWIAAVLIAAIPALDFFKFNHLIDKMTPSAFWPQNLTKGFVFWALLNALIFLVLFVVWHFIFGKKSGGNLSAYGLSTSSESAQFKWRYIGRAFLLAFMVIGGAYIISQLAASIFNVDFRYWVVGLKPMDAPHFVVFLCYLVPFFVFFLVSGLISNSILKLKEFKKEGTSFAVSMIASAVISCIGIFVLCALQLGTLWATNELFFTKEPLYGIVAYQFVPILAFAGLITAYFSRKTRNIYTAAFINAMFVTWYIVAGQAIHFVK